MQVTVEIVDLNDNSPTFAHNYSTVYVSEATLPGQLLFPVQPAYDLDSPQYGVVGYRLMEDPSSRTSNSFQGVVDSSSGGTSSRNSFQGVVGYSLVEDSSSSADTFELWVDKSSDLGGGGGFDVRVILRQPLDRERRSGYQIIVSCFYTHSQ